jgi:hypothetical protein
MEAGPFEIEQKAESVIRASELRRQPTVGLRE